MSEGAPLRNLDDQDLELREEDEDEDAGDAGAAAGVAAPAHAPVQRAPRSELAVAARSCGYTAS